MDNNFEQMMSEPKRIVWARKRSGPGSYYNSFQHVFPRIPEDTKILDEKYKELREKAEKGEIGPLKQVSEALKLLWNRDTWSDGITQRVDMFKKEGRDVRVLDLMGYGAVLRKLDVKGLAVALEDARTLEEKQYDAKRGVGFVEGNALSSKTWQKIKEDVKEHGQFDLILCRPLAGISQIPENRVVYAAFIQRLYRLTRPDRGTILSEIHYDMKPVVERFSKNINTIEGIIAKNTSGAFSLMRFPGSPDQIPENIFQ
ncbi:MAG: hypothetical protein Q8Q30_00745 [Candidatus Woesebacteria bacterium]|nr:hypothetical protein [Candidatus Woesebacteria bacterium]